MSFYGSNTLYPHLPLGGTIPAISMPDFKLNAGVKNNLGGQYSAGDIIVKTSSISGGYPAENPPKGFIRTKSTIYHGRYNISQSNGAMAILVLPHNWLATNFTPAQGSYNYDLYQEVYNKIPYSYTFWIVKNGNLGFSDGQYKQNENRIYQTDGNNISGFPKIGDVTSRSGIMESSLNFLAQLREGGRLYAKWGMDYYVYPQEITPPIAAQLTTLEAEHADFNAVMGSLTASFFSLNNDDIFRCALQIDSSLPIFWYTNLEGLYEYFKSGNTDGSENGNDLKISDVDFATNWKIYVNGARKPNIYVTMDSPDIESYLDNATENTGGYSKEDFKIQYRIPTYTIKDGWTYQIEPTGVIDESTDIYNNTRSSSWSELTDENYDLKVFMIGGIDSAQNLPLAYSMYAQLQFRVYLNDNLFSSWCEFGIGYIGSPSVADFSEMQNWGNVVSINDGSTIEIIYDQLPDDIDDYEEPDDDFPPEGDTEPTDYSLESALTTTYKVELNQLQELGNYLWGATFFDDIKLINNSPIENIVSCKKLPFNIPAGVSKSIVLGNVTTPANGNIISSIPIIEIGTIIYNGYYENFMDYNPFTQLILFLPFCGFVNIDASVVTGKSLNVRYAIDVILGKCKAMIYVDGAYYMSADGDIGIDIPLVSSNRAQVEAAFISQGIEGMLKGDIEGLISAGVATQYHSNRNGSYTPTVAWQETRKCFLIADIPTVQYPSSYGHDVGYPCMLTRTLATMSGFTVCSEDIDMSGFNCTSEEMDMIKQILTTGIYL